MKIWSKKVAHEIALTIKPTMNCNMRCRHCFNGDSLKDPAMLSRTDVYNFIEAACRDYQNVKITFHGGEPTLAGIDFYKDIFDFQSRMADRYCVNLSNNFTTNGILLTDELIEILTQNNTLINISFDGPYNDVLRDYSSIIYEKICKVKKYGGRVRAFCTLSKGSYEHLQEIYQWFNEKEIDFKISPIEPSGYAAMNRELLMDAEKFIEILSDVYRYWIIDKDCRIRFYTFEEFASLRRTTQFKPFWFNREIALNPDGKIYPFGRPNDIQFCIGKPTRTLRLNECFESDGYKRMLAILSTLRKQYCGRCDFEQVCNGVCICMSYMYFQDVESLEYSCNQSRHIFKGILNINDQIQEDFNNRKSDIYNDVIKRKFGECN